MKKSTIIIVLVFLCNCVSSQTKVAVVKPYLEGNASAIHVNLVKQTLVSTILKVDGYQAFSRAEIDAIFTEQSFQYGGDVNDATRKKIGDIYGADMLCISQIVGSGGELLISAMLIDVQTAEIKSSPEPAIVKATTDNVKTAAKIIAMQLLGMEVNDDNQIVSAGPKSSTKTQKKRQLDYNAPDGTTQLPGTELFVAQNDEYGEYRWQEAVNKCRAKGQGWRLPTAEELMMIMKNRFTKENPQGLFSNFDGGWYWSSTQKDRKEYINISTGGWDSGEKPNEPQHVRCVWCNQ